MGLSVGRSAPITLAKVGKKFLERDKAKKALDVHIEKVRKIPAKARKTHMDKHVDELKKIIDSFLRKELEYLSEIKILKEQVRSLQDKLFGRKSEKIPSGQKQLS